MKEKEVVINTCYGGFDLSYEAVMRYAELKGIKLYAFGDDLENHTYVSYNGKGKKPFCLHYRTKPLTFKDEDISIGYFSASDLKRDDKQLVEVIKELREKANGQCAKLEIIKIPTEVEYTIEEYDGIEHIAEKHRTWG